MKLSDMLPENKKFFSSNNLTIADIQVFTEVINLQSYLFTFEAL